MTRKFFQPEPVIFTVGGGEPGFVMDTLGNYKHAIDCGSDVLQTNVSISADRKLVLHSDAIYRNSEIRARGIEFRPGHELARLFQGDTGNPGGVPEKEGEDALFPELHSILEALPGQRFHFFLTGSSPRLADLFLEKIINGNAADRILVSSGGTHMKRIRSSGEDIATSFTFGGLLGFYALFRTGLLGLRKAFPADAIILPEMIGASFIANPGLVLGAKHRGIRSYLLDVNDEASALRFLESGAHGFVTSNAPLVRHVIGEGGGA